MTIRQYHPTPIVERFQKDGPVFRRIVSCLTRSEKRRHWQSQWHTKTYKIIVVRQCHPAVLITDTSMNELGRQAGACPTNTARLLLKADPSKQLVWHELGHFLHWKTLGSDAYRTLPREFGNNVPEQFVFDLLERPSRWGRLSPSYRDHMIDYITNRWGGVGR